MSRLGDAPQWDKPNAAEEQRPPASFGSRLLSFLFFTAVLGGAAWFYVLLGTQSELRATLPMPASLRTVSPAHGDLLRLAHEYEELGADTSSRLGKLARVKPEAIARLAERLRLLHAAARELEPKLSREESRALISLQQGGKLLGECYAGTTSKSLPTPERIELARSQLRLASEIARGKSIDDLVVDKLRRAVSDGG